MTLKYKNCRIGLVKFILVLVIAPLLFTVATAQTYPNKPIRMIVPFPAGTAADIAARRVTAEMSKILNQTIVTDNRAGAGGTTGSNYVAHATPDGYTLLVGTTGTHATSVGLYPSLPYDPIKDFVAITRIAMFGNVLVVPATLNVTSLAQLIDLAKKRRQTPLSYGSGGNGTSSHLGGAQFQQLTGIELLHVPYRGTPPAIVDLLAGRIDIFFANIPIALPYVRTGTLKALAVASPARFPVMPDVPSVAELGLPGAEWSGWTALFAPAGTPTAITDFLYQAMRKSLGSPALKEAFDREGTAIVLDASPAEFSRVLKRDVDKLARFVKSIGATVE